MAEETMKDFMDEIDKSLAKGKDGDGFIWDKLHALLDSGEYVDVEVTEAVKGGVVAFLEEKRGFIPASKLSLSYIDEERKLKSQLMKRMISLFYPLRIILRKRLRKRRQRLSPRFRLDL